MRTMVESVPFFALFVFLLGRMLVDSYYRWQLRRKQNLFEIYDKTEEVLKLAKNMHELPERERRAACRKITEYIRGQSIFCMRVGFACLKSVPEGADEIRTLARSAIRSGKRMHCMATMLLIRLRWMPFTIKNRRVLMRRLLAQSRKAARNVERLLLQLQRVYENPTGSPA
jgi:hypothetical protein